MAGVSFLSLSVVSFIRFQTEAIFPQTYYTTVQCRKIKLVFQGPVMRTQKIMPEEATGATDVM